jgi:hypothetical protein
MDERETGSGEERIDAEGRNPTQQRMDDEGVETAPVDASWTGEPEVEQPSAPAEQAEPSASADAPAAPNEPIFEPDVPLEAEVNREDPPRSRKGVIAAVAGAIGVIGALVLRRRR